MPKKMGNLHDLQNFIICQKMICQLHNYAKKYDSHGLLKLVRSYTKISIIPYIIQNTQRNMFTRMV